MLQSRVFILTYNKAKYRPESLRRVMSVVAVRIKNGKHPPLIIFAGVITMWLCHAVKHREAQGENCARANPHVDKTRLVKRLGKLDTNTAAKMLAE